MNFSDLYYASTKCLSLDTDKEFSIELQSKIEAGEWDINKIIWFCSNHLVITVFYVQLKKAGLLFLIQDDFIAHLKDLYDANTERNKGILKQIDEISHTLAELKIDHIYLKGTGYLLDQVYSDPGERIIGDIDFLVNMNHLNECIEALKKIGYYNPTENQGDILSKNHHHYAYLIKDSMPACVEIHHSPVALKYYHYCSTESVFVQRKSINEALFQYVPSDNHKVLINYIHSRLSNGGHRNFLLNLRTLNDLSMLSKRVNLHQSFANFPDRFKSLVYYILFIRYFKNNKKEEFIKDSKIKRYLFVFDWMNMHPKLMKYTFGIASFPILSYGYFSKFVKAIYKNDYRKYVLYRLKNPGWYKQHFTLLANKLKQFFR